MLARTSASMLKAGSTAVRAMSSSSFKLPDLPYDFNALEPVISAEIMQLHHQKHHNAYVTNLNVAMDKLDDAKAKNDVTAIVQLESAIRFNGGGHLNHSIFWQNLAPIGGGGGEGLEGELLQLINNQYGSPEKMQEKLSAAAVSVQGSGWAWLGYDRTNNALRIAACANQDPLQATTGLVPLFGIDVWEHAYYLQYKNVRPDYVKNIFRVANWRDVARRLEEAKSGN